MVCGFEHYIAETIAPDRVSQHGGHGPSYTMCCGIARHLN